jgi:hypothetical protein
MILRGRDVSPSKSTSCRIMERLCADTLMTSVRYPSCAETHAGAAATLVFPTRLPAIQKNAHDQETRSRGTYYRTARRMYWAISNASGGALGMRCIGSALCRVSAAFPFP